MTMEIMVISIILLVIELFTATTFFIWFALGGFITAIISLVTTNIFILTIVFALSSVGLMLMIRPKIQANLKNTGTETSYEKLINSQGIVETKIIETTPGTIKINGQIWSARSEKTHQVGEEVVVVAIHGSHVIVK